MFVNHGWRVTGGWQRAGRAWMAMVGLVEQTMDVGRQTGGGAHSVVPEHMDHIVQSV